MKLQSQEKHPFIKKLLNLYAQSDSSGEKTNLSLTQQAAQCGQLAINDDESNELICAALLHNLGHILANTALANAKEPHDSLAAAYLSSYFPMDVTEPIRLCTRTKRYLCTTEANYRDSLSSESKLSLKKQGSAMNEKEIASFLKQRYFKEAIKLRRWIDRCKMNDHVDVNFSTYSAHLESSIKPLTQEQLAYENANFSQQ